MDLKSKNWKYPLSELYPASEDWGKLEIPNLAQVSLTKCYWMLQACQGMMPGLQILLFLSYQRKSNSEGKITAALPTPQD